MQLHILQLQSINTPEGLISIIDLYILELQMLHLAEELRAIDHTIVHHHVAAIPNGRATAGGKIATGDQATVDVPPSVFAIKLRVAALDIVTTLDARLTIGNRYILEHHIVGSEERALSSERTVVNRIHNMKSLNREYAIMT